MVLIQDVELSEGWRFLHVRNMTEAVIGVSRVLCRKVEVSSWRTVTEWSDLQPVLATYVGHTVSLTPTICQRLMGRSTSFESSKRTYFIAALPTSHFHGQAPHMRKNQPCFNLWLWLVCASENVRRITRLDNRLMRMTDVTACVPILSKPIQLKEEREREIGDLDVV